MLLKYDLYLDPRATFAICKRAAEGMLFCTPKPADGGWGDMGMGIGDEARGRRNAAWGEELGELDEAGVRARDARSGNSRDFFLVRRDLWTR